MKNASYGIFGLMFLVVAWLASGCSPQPPQADVEADGLALPAGALTHLDSVPATEIMTWDFDRGDYPEAWGWGQWQVEDGVLEGRHEDGWIAVYFTPITCPRDFAIETRVMFPSGSEDEKPKAQLLIRDDAGLRFESGLVLYAAEDVISVRHMAWKKNLLYEVYPTGLKIENDRWYTLCFELAGGRVRAFLNDRPLPLPDLRYPVGEYREPHLAVDGGSARFDYVRILSLH